MALEDMGINMPEQAKENLKKPSEEMQIVLMSRLAEMTEEELQMLDKAITPEVMGVLIKLLPELAQLIQQIGGMSDKDMPREEPKEERMPEDDMGALANVE
tara:strand:- start:209 stop:511 length:303 start_codon:yes stop_codon:yes gene_type:complete